MEDHIKLFLVEDEVIMRDGIKKHIDWAEEGIDFVGEASDGELAYPMIMESQPDILLTDIKMPFMDGLELTELVRQNLPQTQIIILSGYDDFRYAQKAISLGVTEYLLKPISPVRLTEAVRKVTHKIIEERARDARWMSEENIEREEISRNRLMGSILRNELSISQILENAKQLQMNLTAPLYRLILFRAGQVGDGGEVAAERERAGQGSSERIDRPDPMERSDFRSFVKALTEQDDPSGRAYLFDREMDGMALLCMAPNEEKMEAYSKSLLSAMESYLKDAGACDYFFGVGRDVRRLSEVKRSYESANKAYSYRFLVENMRIVYADSLPSIGMVLPKEGMDISSVVSRESSGQLIERFLRTGTIDEIDPFLDGIFLSLGEKNLRSLIFLTYLLTDCYLSIVRFMNELGLDPSKADDACGDVNQAISRLKSWEDAERYLADYMRLALKERDRSAAGKYSRLLQKAVDYIGAHFDQEDLSLQQIAAYVNLSPNHFSTVFSQEMGATFIEYLIDRRMEKACELLMTTELKSSEIAYRVGYKDPHYFSYTFKKMQGVTPKEYRAGHREG